MAQRPVFKLRQLGLSIALCTSAAGVAVLGPVTSVMANPSGATVVHGSAIFTQDAGLLQIDNSPGAIINWSSFSIAQDEITRFQQESAQSAVLNRVTGGEISEIFGQLQSNGHVFLINPNGMVFGQNATIDTAGFVASTLDITNENFLAGDYRFAGDSGRIINQGYLTTRSGNVYFLAPDIENSGIIHAESGALLLAAGRSIRIGSLDAPDIQFEITAPDDAIVNLGQLLADQGSIHAFAGTLTNSGVISASGAALAEDGSVIFYADGDIDLQAGSTITASGAHGGDILVQSQTGTVLNAGTILAEGDSGDGGRIRLLGEQVGLLGAARVSAEGSSNGGEILIGGNLTGLGPEPNAKAVFIGTDTRVSASSTDSGKGGTIIAYADDLNRSYGTLTARGGPNGGDGGFIETSAGFIEVTRTPDAGASNGAPGQWLIDPDLLVIGEDGLVEVTEQDLGSLIFFNVDPEATAPTIQNTLIEEAIDGGTSVAVRTAGNAQSIRIQAPLTFNATTPGLVLEFDTGFDLNGNIFVEAPIINNGTASLDYFFQTEGFVDFGADVDTGGLGNGQISASSSYGGDAVFTADVTLRGNVNLGDTSINGPFEVFFDSDFANLSSLTLLNNSILDIRGSLDVFSFFGTGGLFVSSSDLIVSGSLFAQEVELINSSAFFGDPVDIQNSTFISGSSLIVSGGAVFGDDVIVNNSVLDFVSTLDAPFVDLNASTLTLSGVDSFIDTLRLFSSDVQLDGDFLEVGFLELNGAISGDGTVTVLNNMDWVSGSLFGDPGNLVVRIVPGADVSIATAGSRSMGGNSSLLVEGSLVWIGGDVIMRDASSIIIAADGSFNIDLTTPGTIGFLNGAPLLTIAPTATLNNFGAGVATIDVTTNMNGLAVSSGTDLLFSRGGFHTGSFEGLMGGRISFGGTFANSHTITGPVSGPGTIRFTETEGGVNRVFSDPQYQPFETIIDAGIVRFDVSAETQRLLLSNGAIEVDGQMFVRDRMEWTGGVVNTFGSFGLLNIDEGATLEISGANDKFLSGGARLDNAGTINWLAGDIVMGATAELLNNGTLTTMQADGPRSILASSGTPSLINTALGTLEFASAGDTLPIEIQINSSIDGIVNVDNVALRFAGGGAHGGSYLIDSGSVEFAGTDNHAWQDGLNFAGNGFVEVSSGLVRVDAEAVNLNNLRFSGGNIGGNGDLRVGTSMEWTGGSVGTVGSSGTLTIDNQALLDISGANDKTLRGSWLLDNLGTIDWNAGNIVLRESVRLFNRGALNANLIAGNQSLVAIGAGPTFAHGALATFERSGNASVLTVDAPARMFGNVNVLDGAMRFLGGGIQSSLYFIETGALVDFAGGTFTWDQGINFFGQGIAAVSDGTVLVNAASANVDTMRFSSGTITGNGNLLVGNSMLWTGGTLGSGGFTGSLEVGPDATLDISAAAAVGIWDWRLINAGAVNWFSGDIGFMDNAVLANVGTFNAILSDGPQAFVGHGFATPMLDNNGQFIVDAGAAEFTSSVAIRNFGSVEINNGLTRLLRGSSSSPDSTWNIGDGVLRLEGGLHAATDTFFTGNGTLQVAPDATLDIVGGVFIDNLLLDGGLISGPGDALILNSFTWNSGTIGTPGGFTRVFVEPETDALLTTAGLKVQSDSSLVFEGGSSVVWDGGEIRLLDNALLEVFGDFAIRTDTDITSPDETGYFLSGGSITKDITDGTTRFLTRFDNNGTMTALQGTISLERDGVHEGDFFVLPPAQILFTAGNHDLLGSFENLGDQTFTDATMTIDGPFFANNVIIEDFSTITFNGTYTAASTSILNNSVANFLFAASTGDLTIQDNSGIEGPGTLTVSGQATIDQLQLTRSGDTVFDSTSTLTAGEIGVFGAGLLSLNGTATIGDVLTVGGDGGAVSVGGALTSADIVIDGGTFTGPGDTQIGGTLALLGGGVVDGAGTISVAGTFDWIDGLLAGSGVLDIAPGADLVTNPGAVLTIQDRTLRNRSNIGIDLVDVRLTLNGGAVLDNQGRMRIEKTPGPAFDSIRGTGRVLNSGIFDIDGFITVVSRFDNSGSVTVISNNLRLLSGGMHSGSFQMGSAGSDIFAGLQLGGIHTLGATSALEGESLFVLPSAIITINGAVGLERMAMFGQVILNSDTELNILELAGVNPMLSGTGNITVTDSFRWDNGTIGGTGTVAVAATAQTEFGLGTPTLRTVSGRTLTIADPDARLDSGRLQIINGGVFENRGGFTFATADGAPFTIEGSEGGTFRNTGSVTSASDLILGTNTENSGTLQAPNLDLAAGMTLTQAGGSITTPGTFDVLGTLTQQAGTLSAGTIQFPAGSSATLAGSLSATAAEISGGSLDVGGSATFGNLDLNAGSLLGAGDVLVGGAFAWTGGLVAGTGVLDIAPGGSLTSTPGASLVMQDRTLRNRSNIGIDLFDVSLALNGGAVLDNQGRMRFEVSPDSVFDLFTGTGVILNSGLFEATALGSNVFIANRFDNSGSFTLNSGFLRLQGGGTHSGSFLMVGPITDLGSGRLRVGGTHLFGTGSSLAGSSFGVDFGTTTINGAVNLDSLFVTAGTVAAPGHLILNSNAALSLFALIDGDPADTLMPMLTGTGNISVANQFSWDSGTIGGTGTVAIADTGVVRFGLDPSRPPGTAIPLLTLSGRTLTTAAPDALFERGRLQITNGGLFTNSGGLTIGEASGMPVTIEGGANGTFRNTGTLTGAAGLIFGTTTQNSGTLQAPNLGLAPGLTLTQSGGSITTPGTFNVAGDLMLLGGSLAATTTNVTGSLAGIGTITGNLNNSGLLSPGTSPGEFSIDGNFVQDALGTLVIEFDGDVSQPGVDFDLLSISGSASFDGTLELVALDGFTGTFGTSFQPITYASSTGGFARIVQPEGLQFTAVFGPNGLIAEGSALLNPDGTANIDTDNPPIPVDQEQAELFADAVALSRDRTQENIETTNTTVTLSDEQQQVQEECAERLDRPDASEDSTGQGVGCRSM